MAGIIEVLNKHLLHFNPLFFEFLIHNFNLGLDCYLSKALIKDVKLLSTTKKLLLYSIVFR